MKICTHEETFEVKFDRLNYPFGRKSKPRHSCRPKRIKTYCRGYKELISDEKFRRH
jgi:hypothetical protein